MITIMTRQHYVYVLLLKNGQSYVGVKTSPEGIHPDDNTDYVGSSRYVKAEDVLTKLVLEIFDTREEALASEASYHQFFDVATNPRFANRCRQTNNGFDVYGTTLSEEHKQKLSEAAKLRTGENHPFYGRTHSPESIEKMREAASGENNPMFGRNHSPESIEKMSEAKLGENNGMFGRNRSGENNPQYDSRNHWFYNELTGKSITGHQKHLKDNAKELFGLGICSVIKLKNGKRQQVKGWIYLGVLEQA